MASFILSAFADEASPTIEGQIAALQRNHISLIEPRSVNGRNILDFSEAELADIKAKFDAAGIRVGSLGSPIGKYPAEKPFDVHLAAFLRALRACQILGTDRMRIFGFYAERERRAALREEILRRLRVFLREAKAAGITLCLENEADVYGERPEEMRDLLTSLPDLYGIYDPANYIRTGEDVKAGLEATLQRFGYMHVKDARYANGDIVPAAMGDGDIDGALSSIDRYTDDVVMLTVEPHLHIFDAYTSIDRKELKSGMIFPSGDAAFDVAVSALKDALKNGLIYREGEDYIWRR